MSKLVVGWYDQSGMEYQASTLFDTETNEFFDYDFVKGKYKKRSDIPEQEEI